MLDEVDQAFVNGRILDQVIVVQHNHDPARQLCGLVEKFG